MSGDTNIWGSLAVCMAFPEMLPYEEKAGLDREQFAKKQNRLISGSSHSAPGGGPQRFKNRDSTRCLGPMFPAADLQSAKGGNNPSVHRELNG